MKRAGKQAPAKQNVTFAESGKGSSTEKPQQATPRNLHSDFEAKDMIPWNSARLGLHCDLVTAACCVLFGVSPPRTPPHVT